MTNDLLGADYYSVESAKKYWSVSQYKRFKQCEARALAELQGKWTENRDNTALLVGNYVHSYFESKEVHEKFIEDHSSDMISKSGKTKGQLKTDYLVAKDMISALESDKQFNKFYHGQKEVAVSGLIEGVPFKGKIDLLNVNSGCFIDIKTTKGPIDDEVWVYDDETERNVKRYWFEAYGYILQMAVYRELIRQQFGEVLKPIIYAVTKESPSATCPILIDGDIGQMQMELELNQLRSEIVRLNQVKTGEIEPKPCRKCDYCRANKLTRRVWIY